MVLLSPGMCGGRDQPAGRAEWPWRCSYEGSRWVVGVDRWTAIQAGWLVAGRAPDRHVAGRVRVGGHAGVLTAEDGEVCARGDRGAVGCGDAAGAEGDGDRVNVADSWRKAAMLSGSCSKAFPGNEARGARAGCRPPSRPAAFPGEGAPPPPPRGPRPGLRRGAPALGLLAGEPPHDRFLARVIGLPLDGLPPAAQRAPAPLGPGRGRSTGRG